jgi:hypothetical protein
MEPVLQFCGREERQELAKAGINDMMTEVWTSY